MNITNKATYGATASTEDPIERYMFQYTDLKNNNNKFYLYEVYPHSGGMLRIVTTNGRVGAAIPQIRERICSREELNKLMHERQYRKDYKPVDLHVPDVEIIPDPAQPAVQAQTQDSRVVRLVEWIFSEAGQAIEKYLATSVDKLSTKQIDDGRRLLVQVQTMYSRLGSFDRNLPGFDDMVDLIQEYYNRIPTILPRKIDPLDVSRDFVRSFSEQEDRLNQLESAVRTMKVQRTGSTQFQALGADINWFSPNEVAYKSLVDYIMSTCIHGYRITIKDIYEVCISKERTAYQANKVGVDNKKLLFHGTANRNVRHILNETGLICPKTYTNGRMLGAGVYLADKSSKSTNYCSTTNRDSPHMLLVCEAALGKMFIPERGDEHMTRPPVGYDSVFGKAGYTRTWGSSTLANNEYVVFNTAQQTARYLVTFTK